MIIGAKKMNNEDAFKIYSNDYADFIIDYSGNISALDKYKNETIKTVNYFYAIAYLPVSVMTEDVISKMGYGAIPSLMGLVSEASIESSGIRRIRNIPNFDLRGNGVLIGIIDTGVDYTNSIFRYADGTTKIETIWDQTIISDNSSQNLDYGTEYNMQQINQALMSEDPFQVVPSKDEIGHGTMIAGIAAGNEVPKEGFYGVAPDARLAVVKLKPAKLYLKQFFRLPEDAVAYQENDMIFGIQYLIEYAAKVNKPIVICIAIDTSQYAHDGRGTTSYWLSFQAEQPRIAIINAVGNEGNARRHYFGKIEDSNEYETVELNVGPNEKGFSMELWGISPNSFSIDITSPYGEYIPKISIPFRETRKITFIFEATVIYVDYQIVESQSGDELILLRFTNPTQGIWKFNVYGRGVFPLEFNIWLPMNNYIGNDTFFLNSDPFITLLSLSCAVSVISVTAYDTEDESLFLNAGKGYSSIQVVKPDIAAPGVNIVAPSLDGKFVEVTGTSAAAAHTAGIAAMLMEWGVVKGNYTNLNTVAMKTLMMRGARRKLELTYPNRDWGYGILDIYQIFDKIRGNV